jgi:hypothetical protein
MPALFIAIWIIYCIICAWSFWVPVFALYSTLFLFLFLNQYCKKTPCFNEYTLRFWYGCLPGMLLLSIIFLQAKKILVREILPMVCSGCLCQRIACQRHISTLWIPKRKDILCKVEFSASRKGNLTIELLVFSKTFSSYLCSTISDISFSFHASQRCDKRMCEFRFFWFLDWCLIRHLLSISGHKN